MFAYPDDHDLRMAEANKRTALLGWRKDESTMADLRIEADRLLRQAAEVVAGTRPLVRSLVQDLITLCSDLNIKRHDMPNREAATQLLDAVHRVRDKMRQLWGNPHTPEIHAQLALLQPAYDALNGRLNDQWSECRSESIVAQCAELGQALRARRYQLQQRSAIFSFANQAV